jgi:NAD(P)-dependent dehydrogenase (short-subunit alcohol dehydrogenase family)
MVRFNPETDIPDLAGRVFLVTGASSGLGEQTVTQLAQHNPAKIYLAARNHGKAEEAMKRIKATSQAAAAAKIEILNLDLASFDSIKAAASRINQEADRLDILQLNGGIAVVPHATTQDGYEIQFGTNYLGHALLTQLLMPKLLATAKIPGADVRIVSMSSIGHKGFSAKDGVQLHQLKSDMKTSSGRSLYGQAMLAKNLFAFELAKRYPQITSSSLHPGTVKTGVWSGDKDFNPLLRHLLINPFVSLTGVSVEEGAKTQLWCSFGKDVKNGAYYEPIGKLGKESALARDAKMSRKLWEWTETELKAHGAPGWPEK